MNRIREQAALSIVAAVVNIALSIALVRHIGSLGVISGTILSYVFVLVIPQSVLVGRILKELETSGEVKEVSVVMA
jgi:O-antigen/teichoic acid export membrane protein